jgi:hypothetical protein
MIEKEREEITGSVADEIVRRSVIIWVVVGTDGASAGHERL